MGEMIPRSILIHSRAIAICLSDLTDRKTIDCLLNKLEIPKYEFVKSTQMPWQNEDLLVFLDEPTRTKFIVFAETIEPIEIAIVLMALQKGYEVYFSCSSNLDVSEISQHRLRQFSAFVLTREEILSELKFYMSK